MKNLLILLSLLFILSACDEGPVTKSSTNDYLPLQIGNYWKFTPLDNQGITGYSFKRVISKTYLNGLEYYAVVSGWANPDEVVADTTYYRITSEGYVYEKSSINSPEENPFRLKGQDGDSWTYPIYDGDVANIYLFEETLILDTESLKDCKSYSFDVVNWADEEYITTLAKGIGFAKEYSPAWGMGHQLKSAVINGKKLTF